MTDQLNRLERIREWRRLNPKASLREATEAVDALNTRPAPQPLEGEEAEVVERLRAFVDWWDGDDDARSAPPIGMEATEGGLTADAHKVFALIQRMAGERDAASSLGGETFRNACVWQARAEAAEAAVKALTEERDKWQEKFDALYQSHGAELSEALGVAVGLQSRLSEAQEALRKIADDPVDEPATWGGAAEWMRRLARAALARLSSSSEGE